MKNFYLIVSSIVAIFSLTISGCKFTTTENPVQTGGAVTISGTVVESTSGNPVHNASINIIGGTATKITSTDNSGKFSAEVGLNQDASLTILTSRTGYDNDTTIVYAAVGSAIQVPLIQLVKQQGAGGGTSGQAASIYLYSQSAQSIGVKESGSNETVQFIFEVLDSTGVPIGADNSVLISFSLGSSPGGGEYLYPASAQSNALGRAAVTLNTGTIAGVAQIIAAFTINTIVQSEPILIAIYGGFPDPNHFAVASEKLNYPAFGNIGYQIPFTAFVGDKYSNPVRPGTSVYFSATSGIIGGSNVTDQSGQATVTLFTQPYPELQGYGRGFFQVTASTIDENSNNIQTLTVRLLSGFPTIMSVDPSTIDMQNGESKLFNLTVSDENGNPLSEGQSITVKVNKGDLEVTGNVDIRMLDTQSNAATMFTFTAIDSKPDTTQVQLAIIDIETSGPNGERKISITGTSR